jgi:TolA-binding protein
MKMMNDDELIASLSDSARRQAAEDAGTGPTPAAWNRLQAIRARDAAPSRPRWLLVTAVAALALSVGGWRLWRTRPLTYTVVGSVAQPGGYIRGDNVQGADLRFSDGTHIELGRGGRLSVVAQNAHGARLRLEEGEAHLDVVHLPRAAWSVEAGPFVVKVTGTSFDVRWSAVDETIEVRMRTGSVKVIGPLVADPVPLRAGQRLTARLASRELRIDQAEPTAQAAPTAQPAPAPQQSAATQEARAVAPAPEPEPAPALEPVPAPAKPEPRAPSSRAAVMRRPAERVIGPVIGPRWHPAAWPARVAGGESDAIVAEVDLHGVERTLTEVDGSALAALADAARYARRNELAVRTLMEQRHRFPISAAAQTAAFQLGRLADDRGAGQSALGWYRRYLTEAPTGPYAAEALGREMLTVERLSGREAARPFAREYLQRFPDGTYLLQAHSILANR